MTLTFLYTTIPPLHPGQVIELEPGKWYIVTEAIHASKQQTLTFERLSDIWFIRIMQVAFGKRRYV